MNKLAARFTGITFTFGILLYCPPVANTNTVIIQYEYRDAEKPIGTINGINARFTVVYVPNPAASLQCFRNGLLLTNGIDYTLSTNVITFTAIAIPKPGDVIITFYRH